MNGALIVPSTVNTVRTSTCLSYANPYSTNPSVVWNSTYIKGTFLGSFAQGTPAFVTFNVAISGLGDGLNSVKLQVTGYDVNFFQGTQTFCCGACCPSGCATQSQTLSFTSSAPTSAMVGGATYSVAAISTSGLSVVVTVGSSSTSVCSLSGGIVSFQAAGTCTLNANQAGNANYNSATQVQQTFLVGKGLQSISFTSSAPAAIVSGPGYTATAASSAGLPVTLTVNAGSSSVCTISSGVVSFQSVGTCVLNANQAGDANYNVASQIQQSFSVSPGLQTISFTSTAPSSSVVGGASYAATATASSGLPVSLTSDSPSVCTVSFGTVSFVAVGTCTIRATQGGNSNYQAATPVTQSFSVSKGSQSISFSTAAPVGSQVGGTPLYVPLAVSTSGLAVVISINISSASVCTISGGSVSYIGVGNCVVLANQQGNAQFNAASQVTQMFSVAKGVQMISFTSTAPSGAQVGGSTYAASAISSAGLPVTITVAPSSASVCMVSGNIVSFTGSGTCVLYGDQVGDSNYLAAARTQQSFGVGLQLQTISFLSTAPLTATFGGSGYTPLASSSSGLTVEITTATNAVCTISSGTVSFVGVGTCTLNANQAGSSSFNAAAQVQQSFTVNKASQSISFSSSTPPSAVVAGATYAVLATASSGLSVVVTVGSSSTSVCSLSGGIVSFQAAGTCTLNANQAGNANYNSATQVQQTFLVGKGLQSISFTSSAPAAIVSGPGYTATAASSAGLPVTLTVNAGSSSVCTISSGVVSFQSVGTCVLNANQAGDANYNVASQIQQSFSVSPGLQTISFTSTAPSSSVVGGASYAATATASSGLPVSLTSDSPSVCTVSFGTVSFVAVGTCTIRATQGGNSNYQAATPVTQSFSVSKGSQSISFSTAAPVGSQVGGTPLYVPLAVSTSGLAVSIGIDGASASVCSISGGSVSFIGVGTCTVVANQAGNMNYNAAIQVVQSFLVSKGAQAIAFTSVAPPGAQVGGSVYIVAAVSTSGLAVSVTVAATSSSVCAVSGNTVSFIGNGTCLLYGDQSGSSNYLAAARVEQTFGVGLQLQTVSFLSAPPAAAVFGGLSYTPIATSSSGLQVALSSSTLSVCSIQSGIVSFVGVGTCTVNANQAGSSSFNAAAQVQQSFSVNKASQSMSFNSPAPVNARVGGPPYNLSAASTSGLPVSVSVAGSSSLVCSLSGDVVTFQSTGTCSLIGIQAGSSNFNAATPVMQAFTVSKGTQTLVFTSSVPAGALAGGPTYRTTVSTTSGLPVVFSVDNLSLSVCSVGTSSGVVSFLGTGTCIIVARQAGNTNFEPAADVTQFFGVGLQLQSVAFTSVPPTAAIVGSQYRPSATSSSGLVPKFEIDPLSSSVCTLLNDTVSFVAVGSCAISVSQPGNSSYNPAERIFQIIQVSATPASSVTPSTSTGPISSQTLQQQTTPPSIASEENFPIGPVIGGVVGGVLLVTLAVVCVLLYARHKRSSRLANASSSSNINSVDVSPPATESTPTTSTDDKFTVSARFETGRLQLDPGFEDM